MEYTTEFDEVNEIFIVHVTGELCRPDDSIMLQKLVFDFSSERGCYRFLINMRQAQIIGGAMDTFWIGTIPVDTSLKMKNTPHKVALVYSSINADEIFLENVVVNRGYNLKVFTKIDKAIEWLKTN